MAAVVVAEAEEEEEEEEGKETMTQPTRKFVGFGGDFCARWIVCRRYFR